MGFFSTDCNVSSQGNNQIKLTYFEETKKCALPWYIALVYNFDYVQSVSWKTLEYGVLGFVDPLGLAKVNYFPVAIDLHGHQSSSFTA